MIRASAGGAALAYRLPGEWWEIPLGSTEAVTASVRALVRTRLGRRDDLAAVRAEQRRRLVGAATRAMAAGATQLHVSQRDDDGVAFASMLTEYRPRLPLGDRAEPALVADALARALAASEAPDVPPGAHWETFVEQGGAMFGKADGFVLRLSRTQDAPSSDGSIPALTVDYWLTVPGRAASVLATFTTALTELAPLMTELFDGVIAAAEWVQDAAAGALLAELGAPAARRG